MNDKSLFNLHDVFVVPYWYQPISACSGKGENDQIKKRMNDKSLFNLNDVFVVPYPATNSSYYSVCVTTV